MSLIELFLIAVGLSMDAFAVSICKGLSMGKVTLKKAMIVGGWFGFFQGAMPLIGYFLGVQFQNKITALDHWVAFLLLAVIGANMIKESLEKEECCDENREDLSFKSMFMLAVATSIDALAIGVTFAFLQVQIVWAGTFIAAITFTISAVGVKIGNVFGMRYKSKAELLGGVILILMGLKILLEHLGILG